MGIVHVGLLANVHVLVLVLVNVGLLVIVHVPQTIGWSETSDGLKGLNFLSL